MTIRNRLQTAMLDEQAERLDAAIKTIAAVTGRGISEIEDAVVNLVLPPPHEHVYKGSSYLYCAICDEAMF